MTTREIELEKLERDKAVQSRVTKDRDTIDAYEDLYRSGVKLPPLDVFFDGEVYWIADGFHRWEAAMSAGLESLSCRVHKGSKEDAQWFACAANQSHGLRRTNEDKANAVKIALAHPNGKKKSDRAIAEYVGVSHDFVGKIRRLPNMTTGDDGQLSHREGKDGKARRVKKQNTKPRPALLPPNLQVDDHLADADTVVDDPNPPETPDGSPEPPTSPQGVPADESGLDDALDPGERLAGASVAGEPSKSFADYLDAAVYRWLVDHPDYPLADLASALEYKAGEVRDRMEAE